jgi:hypothetical protein
MSEEIELVRIEVAKQKEELLKKEFNEANADALIELSIIEKHLIKLKKKIKLNTLARQIETVPEGVESK